VSTPPCLLCGGTKRVEWHHVYGRANQPSLMVPLCREHHWLATGDQYAFGVDLRHEGDRHPVERIAEGRLSLASFFVFLAEAEAATGRELRSMIDWLDQAWPDWRKHSPRRDDD